MSCCAVLLSIVNNFVFCSYCGECSFFFSRGSTSSIPPSSPHTKRTDHSSKITAFPVFYSPPTQINCILTIQFPRIWSILCSLYCMPDGKVIVCVFPLAESHSVSLALTWRFESVEDDDITSPAPSVSGNENKIDQNNYFPAELRCCLCPLAFQLCN